MNPEISRNSHHRRQNFSALDIGLKSEFFIIVKTTEYNYYSIVFLALKF
jgi:hypothetical protein